LNYEFPSKLHCSAFIVQSSELLGSDWLLLRFRGSLAALRSLRAEALREPLDPSFGVDELLAAGEERVTVIADLEVQL
jgi:hypothetical protein